MPQTTLVVFREAPDKVPLIAWLDDLEQKQRKAYTRCLDRIQQLEGSGYDLRRPAADLLRDGIYELRSKVGRIHYRILYFFCGKNVA